MGLVAKIFKQINLPIILLLHLFKAYSNKFQYFFILKWKKLTCMQLYIYNATNFIK